MKQANENDSLIKSLLWSIAEQDEHIIAVLRKGEDTAELERKVVLCRGAIIGSAWPQKTPRRFLASPLSRDQLPVTTILEADMAVERLT